MELIVVSFMRVDHGIAELQCQWAGVDERALVQQINNWFDSVNEPHEDEDDIERLLRLDDVARYLSEHADYFSVDVTRHTLS